MDKLFLNLTEWFSQCWWDMIVDIGMLIWERCHHYGIQDAKFKPRNVAPKSNMDSYLLNLSPLLHKQVPCQLKLDFLKIYSSVAKETLQTPMSVQLSFCHQNSQASNHNNESLHAQLHSWKTNFFCRIYDVWEWSYSWIN